MRGPAGVTALVLAETVAGGLAVLYLSPLWNEVKRGFFTLTASVLLILSASTWGAAAAGRIASSDPGRWSARLAAALTLVVLADVILMFARRRAAARVAGFVGVIAVDRLARRDGGDGRGIRSPSRRCNCSPGRRSSGP